MNQSPLAPQDAETQFQLFVVSFSVGLRRHGGPEAEVEIHHPFALERGTHRPPRDAVLSLSDVQGDLSGW